jgi:hypothetical protein
MVYLSTGRTTLDQVKPVTPNNASIIEVSF